VNEGRGGESLRALRAFRGWAGTARRETAQARFRVSAR